jgi:hypothetical protein
VVYGVEVEYFHNYFVGRGDDAMLVHNGPECVGKPVVVDRPTRGRVGLHGEAYHTGYDAIFSRNSIIFNKTHAGSQPVPKGRGPGGGLRQSHHGLQQEWAKQNLGKHGYDPDLAPTVTIETGQGYPHSKISELQNARRDARVSAGNGKWSSTIDEELGYIVSDFRAAGFKNGVISQVLEQQYRMLDKLGASYTRVPGF